MPLEDPYGRGRLLDDIQAMSDLALTLRGDQPNMQGAHAGGTRDLSSDDYMSLPNSRQPDSRKQVGDVPSNAFLSLPKTQSQMHRREILGKAKQPAGRTLDGRGAAHHYGHAATDNSYETIYEGQGGAPASSATGPQVASASSLQVPASRQLATLELVAP